MVILGDFLISNISSKDTTPSQIVFSSYCLKAYLYAIMNMCIFLTKIEAYDIIKVKKNLDCLEKESYEKQEECIYQTDFCNCCINYDLQRDIARICYSRLQKRSKRSLNLLT